jgi:hypothetical protein
VLVEAVGHLVEAEPGVLEADLLADHVEGQRRQAAVHLAHDAGEHRAVAHAGVEHAHRRRLGMQVGELQVDAARHHLLLAAGVDEQQIFLAVVEEAEVARGRAFRVGRFRLQARRPAHAQQLHQLTRRDRRLDALAGEEDADALQRLRRDAGAIAQAGDELAVVDGAPTERGFGHARAPAKFRDAVQ